MDISQYEIIITRHAIQRAHERGIDEDIIERVILTSPKINFGKNHAKWIKKYKTIDVICIGCIENNTVRIITVETK